MRESAFTLQDILWLFQIWLSLVCSSLTRIIWFWHYWLHPPMIWRITSRSGFLTTPAPKICGKEGFGRLALIGLGNRGEGNEQQIARETKKHFLHSSFSPTCIQCFSCPDRSIHDLVSPQCHFEDKENALIDAFWEWSNYCPKPYFPKVFFYTDISKAG